jgi:phosphoribosylformimino-5-aminoimidazole carboxamide ribotide isomerase
MIVIPAVDIKDRRCVRLRQGDLAQETVYSDDPAAMARKWAELGAELIHVVDLDGAVAKRPRNTDSIRRIVEQVRTPVQVGGGIRTEKTIRAYLDLGVARVIIGSEAIQKPDLVKRWCETYPGRIVVAIDAREGFVAMDGWTRTTGVKAVDLAKQFEGCGVAAINFTDIYRDGMQTGPNIEQTRRLAESVDIAVVASGGVSCLEDVRRLVPLESFGVVGVIVGRALYSGTLDFQKAVAVAKSVPA